MVKMRPGDYTQFRKSKPWGYYPPAVEEKVKQYESTIEALTEKLIHKNHLVSNLKQNIEQLQDELREMHLQMSSLELPEASEAVEHFVLDDFKNYNSGKFDDVEEPTIVGNQYNESEFSNSLEESKDSAQNGEEPEFIIVQ